MSTTTLIKKAIVCSVEEWCKVFPKEAVENFISSGVFIKRLTTLLIGTITHRRSLLPEDCFTMEDFCGIQIMTLKYKSNNELGQFLITALLNAYEAFDKKYLAKLVLCLYSGECISENLTEYYSFEYCYNEEGISVQMRSKSGGSMRTRAMQNVRKQTLEMIAACCALLDDNLDCVVAAKEVAIRLYYNSDTPEDYQAPGYTRGVGCDDPLEETLARTVEAGCVETPYHQIALRGYLRHSVASLEAVAAQSAAAITQQTEGTSRVASDTSVALLSCVCNGFEMEGDPTLDRLTCQYCNTQQHAVCYGVISSHTSKTHSHCCVQCASADPRRSCDRRLSTVGERRRTNVSIFRRSLALCARAPALSAQWLRARLGVPRAAAQRVARVLHSNGVTDRDPLDDDTMQVNVIPGHLQVLMEDYFNVPEDDIIDRLREESQQGSQELPDPVGELLSQEGRAALRSTLPLCRVIDNPEKNNNVDSTLKQYREALIRDEELPLSGDLVKDMKIERGRKSKAGEISGPKCKRAKNRRGSKV